MKTHYFGRSCLTVFVVTLLVLGSKVYADDVNPLIQGVRAHRAQIESQLGIDPTLDTYPRATSYYDDLEDHYEHAQLVRDDIDQGLPPGDWWAPVPS